MEGQSSKRVREDNSDPESAQQAKRLKLSKPTPDDKGFCLLSFDGSEIGTTELSELRLLKEIMQRIQDEYELDETPTPFEYFDLIGGTGIGGIFAIFFALWHMSVDEVIGAYMSLYENVFTSEAWINNDTKTAGRLFDQTVHEIASKHGNDADTVMGTIKRSSTDCKGFLCTLDPENATHPRLLCTYRVRSNRPPDCNAVQALTASISGQSHLDPVALGFPPTKFISANSRFANPTTLVLKQAQDIFGSDRRIACVVSLGSGQRNPVSIPTNRAADSDEWVKLAQDADRSANEMARRCGETKDFLFRLNVTHGLEDISSLPNLQSAIVSHTDQYLRHMAIEHEIDRLVQVLCERPACVTTERLNSIIGPDVQDKVLEAVKVIQVDTKLKLGLDQDDRYHDIVSWLSPTHSVYSNLKECRQNREEGTGLWALRSDEFCDWVSGATRLLTLQGIPGGGKTILASIVYDHLENRFRSVSDIKVLGAFISYGVTRSIDDILSCLLCQLLHNDNGQVAGEIEALYKKRSDGRPSTGDLLGVLSSKLSQTSRSYIVLDALDEFPSHSRQKLLDALLNISSAISLFVTSRPILYNIAPDVSVESLYMDASEQDDLECFVTNRIEHDERLSRLLSDRQDLSELVLNAVLKKCNKMFLLARFHMDELAKFRTPIALKNALSSLPMTASAKYEITFDRIKQQQGMDGTYALHILAWMTLGPWRLSVGELVLAVASSSGELGDNGTTALSVRDIVDVCSGLVVVLDGYPSFVHLTAQQHFRNHFSEVNKDRFCDAHYALTVGCLRYLAVPRSPEIVFGWYEYYRKTHLWFSTSPDSDEARKFFEYCSKNWGDHARRLLRWGECLVQLPSHCLQLYLSDKVLSEPKAWGGGICDGDQQIVTALRNSSFSGILSACVFLAVKIRNSSMITRRSLSLASEKGQYKIVELLLQCHDSAKVSSIRDKRCQSNVWCAPNENQDIVKLKMLDNFADARGYNGRSPLSYAAENGHFDIAKLFLGRSDVEIDSQDCKGRYPLSYALENGCMDIAKLLLSRPDVEVDSRDNDGRSPLSYAAENGHLDIVKLLLGRSDVEADSRDRDGRSPLLYAAKHGDLDVLKLFFGHSDVDINTQDSGGQSHLLCAVNNGHFDVVKLLLGRSGVDTNAQDNYGQSPLTYAAKNGHLDIVKLLLGLSDVDTNARDKYGRSPLLYAAKNGHLDVVELFLSNPGTEVDSQDKFGRSPLSYAAENGHLDIVRLLGRLNVETDSRDCSGRSSFSYAAKNGYLDVVKLFLGRSDVDINSRDHNGRSPLSYAANNGHLGVVKLLLGRSDVETDPRDIHGRSPLLFTAMNRHQDIVELLRRPDAGVNSRDANGRSPLSFSAQNGHGSIVELLLGHSDVETNSRDLYGRSPLLYAVIYGHLNIVKMFLNCPDFEMGSQDRRCAELCAGLSEKHQAISELLSQPWQVIELT